MHPDQFLAVGTRVQQTDSPDQRSFFSRLRVTCLEPFRNSTGAQPLQESATKARQDWFSTRPFVELEATVFVRMGATISLPNGHLLDIFCASEHQPWRIHPASSVRVLGDVTCL
jgi:hypothetical protein